MHASSMENMRRCVDWYLSSSPGKVIDLGAMNVNGSYRELMPAGTDYVGVDLEPGPGVDVVLDDVYTLPFDDNSIDVVTSGQMLEHCGHFWRVFSEIFRVLKPNGLAFLIAPSSGPVHRYPVDCYRFYPDSFQALAEWSGLRLVHSWTDERGPWRDIVGVFEKGSSVQRLTEPRSGTVAANQVEGPNADPAVEKRAGSRPYLDVLQDIQTILTPALYLEIGVRRGRSLALAQGPAIAIDPDPHPDFSPGAPGIEFYRCTSDDFFFFHGDATAGRPVQLAFIDGLHLAENVYRDFMNVEPLMDRAGVIVIDDVFPNHPDQARRERVSQVWSGDVWRFAEWLAVKRPDLKFTWLDADPTGLLLISRLNPKNRVLWSDYNKAIRHLADTSGALVPERLLSRENAVVPTLENLRAALDQ